MNLVGVRIMAGAHGAVGAAPRVVCEYRLSPDGHAEIVSGADTWICEMLSARGVVISGFAIPTTEAMSRRYGVKVTPRTRYYPNDGAPFLIGVLADVDGTATWSEPIVA